MNSIIFLDGGDANETRRVLDFYPDLKGQTTNPSLIANNPEVKEKISAGKRFSEKDIEDFYKQVVADIASCLPNGSISIEVYADASTPSEDMLKEAREKSKWITRAYIKFPITENGLEAAKQAVGEGMRVNMTLCFSQEQAAAVYAATKGAPSDSVYVSPFVGRLDDQGVRGMSLIENIVKMYAAGDGHVKVLSASIRNVAHVVESLSAGADIVTVPAGVLELWQRGEVEERQSLKSEDDVTYQELDLSLDWKSFDIKHPLTDVGLEKFVADWKSLLIE